MWHTGYSAGLDHVTSLSQMGDFSRSRLVGRLRAALLDGVKSRNSLTDTIRKQSEGIVPFEAALLELGEESGQLDAVLKLLGDYFAAEHRMVLRVKKHLAYPMVNAVAASFIVAIPVLIFGNPVAYFLAIATQLAMLAMFGGTVLMAVVGWYRNRPKFVIGRFCRALALAVEAGLSLDRVATLAVAAADNVDLQRHFDRIDRRTMAGQPLARTFSGTWVLPREVVAALDVADASGNYGDTMRKLAELYDV